MKWPRCNARFFTKESADWAVQPYIWRRCNRPWGHWFAGLNHEGPVIEDADA